MKLLDHAAFERWRKANLDLVEQLEQTDCQECHGSGVSECWECHSQIDCPECDGTGKGGDVEFKLRRIYLEQQKVDAKKLEVWIEVTL